MSVTIIIPTLNEADNIGGVVAAIPAGVADEVLVVDGGSADGTVEVAERAGARVIVEPRRGYGRACATGVVAASGEILAFLDGDGADDPSQITSLVSPVALGRADMVLGSRLAGEIDAGAMPFQQRFGNQMAAWVIRRLYGLSITDLGPHRAVSRLRLLDLGMAEMTYGWPTEMIVKAARSGWCILEVPVRYRSRGGGRSKISGTLTGTVLSAYHILRTIARHAR